MDRFCDAGTIPLWREWLQRTIRKGRRVSTGGVTWEWIQVAGFWR